MTPVAWTMNDVTYFCCFYLNFRSDSCMAKILKINKSTLFQSLTVQATGEILKRFKDRFWKRTFYGIFWVLLGFSRIKIGYRKVVVNFHKLGVFWKVYKCLMFPLVNFYPKKIQKDSKIHRNSSFRISSNLLYVSCTLHSEQLKGTLFSDFCSFLPGGMLETLTER